MKKRTKIAIVIALICIVLGAVLAFFAMASVHFNFSQLNTVKYETKTHEIHDSFSNIRINAAEYDIHLLPSQSSTCKVIYPEGDYISYDISVENGTLTITPTDQREWYKNIGIYWGSEIETVITVYLPEQEYADLYLKSLSGDISVPDDFAFSQAEVYSTSGEILYSAITGHDLTTQTTSGDLSLRNLTAGDINITSTSGEVELSNVKASAITAHCTSGDVSIQSTETKYGLLVETTSGEIELSDVIASTKIEIDTTSGEIELERCDAQGLFLKSNSGDISGTLLSEKRFVTDTTSGDVNVPNTAPLIAGTCEVTTTSGDIRFKIVN